MIFRSTRSSERAVVFEPRVTWQRTAPHVYRLCIDGEPVPGEPPRSTATMLAMRSAPGTPHVCGTFGSRRLVWLDGAFFIVAPARQSRAAWKGTVRDRRDEIQSYRHEHRNLLALDEADLRRGVEAWREERV